MDRYIGRLLTIIKNCKTVLYGFMVRKSKKCVLFGSWMGEKFADNSRFLFQYLHENKKKLDLEHVIWATRSYYLHKVLTQMGYESVLIGTKESDYWHYKCGIHIICNTQIDSKTYHSDIDTKLSAGAVKIQLWHGNGIKCVPGNTGLGSSVFLKFFRQISTQGLWYVGNYFFLCKSDIDFDFFRRKFLVDSKYCIDSAYPRTCECLKYLDNEVDVISKLSQYHKVIMFLPTFRDKYVNYIHPLKSEKLIEYLRKNNILWIEKPHTADKSKSTIFNQSMNNVLALDSTFDINILMPLIDVLVTDYSSAMLDAMFFRKQIVYYVPDYEYYTKDDRGFLMDYDSVCINLKVLNVEDIVLALDKLFLQPKYNSHAESIRSMFWKHDNWSYEEIWASIVNDPRIANSTFILRG